ncbi:MAG: hypothetical protein ACOYIR_03190 [Christensenellales bacterium]
MMANKKNKNQQNRENQQNNNNNLLRGGQKTPQDVPGGNYTGVGRYGQRPTDEL